MFGGRCGAARVGATYGDRGVPIGFGAGVEARPVGSGVHDRGPGEQTARSSTDTVATAFDRDVDKPVIDAIESLAAKRGVPMARIALAWVLSKPVVSCPIVGATKPHHLTDAVAALDITLTHDEIAALEQPCTAQNNHWW